MSPDKPVSGPHQTVFDLDGRQEISDYACELEDDISTLKAKLASCESSNECLEAERDIWKIKWIEMQKDLKKLARYDIEQGGCDESACNAQMRHHKFGDYLEWSDVERICEL